MIYWIYFIEGECIRIRYQGKQVAPQASSEDPNLNLSFLNLFEKDRNEKKLNQLVHTRTCGLHTLHNSMKHDEKASGWNLKKLLSSLHRIFDESSSRRADYEALTQAISSDHALQSVHIVGLKMGS